MDQVRKQVFETFGNCNTAGERFESNLEKLVSIMSNLTAQDVNLDPGLLLPCSRSSAPVTYIEILEHPRFTINMFVLRPGSKLPLHDHPQMHGICKVVQGKVRIRNFTLEMEDSAVENKRIIARIEPEKIVSELDSPVVLTPKKGNIHEIQAVDGGAAFVDVLAPPYLSDIDGRGPRPCHYFIEVKSNLNGYAEFVKVNRVSDYWTDFSPYLGP